MKTIIISHVVNVAITDITEATRFGTKSDRKLWIQNTAHDQKKRQWEMGISRSVLQATVCQIHIDQYCVESKAIYGIRTGLWTCRKEARFSFFWVVPRCKELET